MGQKVNSLCQAEILGGMLSTFLLESWWMYISNENPFGM